MSERHPAPPAAEIIARRAERRRSRGLRLLGTVLILYGLSGIVLFAVVALNVARPIDEASRLTVSIEGQRTAALDALAEAARTIDETARGVRGMDVSLDQASLATDRAANLSRDVATTMFGLQNAMSITILGTQPLIGLAASFQQAGQQLALLALDVAAIGEALEANRDDVHTVAEAMDRLGLSVEALTQSVRDGPRLEASSEALAELRLAIYALLAWMLAFAVGCVVGGVGCWLAARRRAT
jgi:hypothetical protein